MLVVSKKEKIFIKLTRFERECEDS